MKRCNDCRVGMGNPIDCTIQSVVLSARDAMKALSHQGGGMPELVRAFTVDDRGIYLVAVLALLHVAATLVDQVSPC
jgi:hypothetical protein